MFLTPQQVAILTGKVYPSAQIRALREMGIDHIVRPDGKPVVLRSAVEPLERVTVEARAIEPDFSVFG